MAHDSYQCQNEQVTRTAPLKVFPFPTQRAGKYYVGGAGGDLYPEKCPEACRPPHHKVLFLELFDSSINNRK